MAEQIAAIFGMIFVGIIGLCLLWTIIDFISPSKKSKNQLEENLKKWEEKRNGI